VPLKVLLADDNITAQRMGCKILADAGYSVVAVSNGAAAVKKIASEKPQLIILDVYMPGYTGLEVCDKVKSAPETARIPVLLTITSLEPFKPEDGNRVKADGVLTKPFEATDLLAVVRKLEEKLHPAEDAQTTVKMAAVQDFSDQSYADWKAEAGPDEQAAKPAELPHEVGSAPLLGIEGLDAHPIFAVESSPAPLAVESQAAEVPIFGLNAPAPGFDLRHAEAPESAPVIAPPSELEFTSAPQAGPTEVAPAVEFEPTLQADADQVPVVQESALATDPSDYMQFATKFGQEHPEDIPVGIAMEAPPREEEEEVVEIHEFVAESGQATEAASFEHEMRHALETSGDADAAVAPAREPELEPEAGIDTQPLEIFPEPHPAPATEIEAPPEPPAENYELTQKLVSEFADELEAAQREAPPEPQPDMEPPAAAATTPAIAMDEQHVAEVVDRVLERYKEELVAAILRELQS
jgi:CheY-like chemotaxis protein